MPIRGRNKESRLFLLRVWREQDEDGALLWCGILQNTVSGAERQFRTLDELAVALQALLVNPPRRPGVEADPPSPPRT